jgi:hypothetical protein
MASAISARLSWGNNVVSSEVIDANLHHKVNLVCITNPIYFSPSSLSLPMPSSMSKLLLALVLTQGLAARGQSALYGVYYTTGNSRFNQAHGGAVQLLTTHTRIVAGDKLTLLDNIAEVTLFARDTSYIRLEGKGIYTVAQLDKMPRTRIRDTIMMQYFALFWNDAIHPGPATSSANTVHATAQYSKSIVLAPRAAYITSLDSLIFRWTYVSWARKYFLRIRSPDGQLCYDSVVADTQAIVHFPGRMPAGNSAEGNSYAWALDIVGESGRLQFADTGHFVLVNDFAIIPHLPTIPMDSMGGIAPILERIEQYEKAGCTKEAEAMFFRLINDYPEDNALDKLYIAFRRRNYL